MGSGPGQTERLSQGAGITTSRREAIQLGLAALAAAGVSVLSPARAMATTGVMQFGAFNDAGASTTSLRASTNESTLRLVNDDPYGTSLWCDGSSINWSAMFTNSGTGSAIYVEKSAGTGIFSLNQGTGVYSTAIAGRLGSATSAGSAVTGTVRGSAGACGVAGTVEAGGTGYGVKASTAGTGGALQAEVSNASNSSAAVLATHAGNGPGVWALVSGTEAALKATNYGSKGYAIHASGGKAQMFVTPASTAGAPKEGSHLIGEHFTDSTGREYVCITAGTPGSWQPVLRGGANTTALTVKSNATTTPAIKAQASAVDGAALRVEGKMTMTRSGKAYIAEGKSSLLVTVPGGLTSSSIILCTPQDSAGSGVYVRYALRDSNTQFKIQLNKACTSSVYVGWMVLG